METPFILWQAESAQLTIEFSRVTLEQIRRICFASINGIQRGGKGVGGLFYGTRLGSHYRVVAWRQIDCSYSHGEAFQLNGNDELVFESRLSAAPPDGTMLLGWFASHPRGGLLLSPEERRIHGIFFSSSERLMLTMRATRAGELAIVVHAPMPGDRSGLHPCVPELRVEPMPLGEFESASPGAIVDLPLVPPSMLGMKGAGTKHTTYFAVGFSAVLVVTAALSVLTWQLSQTGLLPAPEDFVARLSPPTRLLSVHARHKAPRLDVAWDIRAYQSASPEFAAITYVAGATQRSVHLDRAALDEGYITIPMKESPLSITMLVRTAKGRVLRETVQIISPVIPPDLESQKN